MTDWNPPTLTDASDLTFAERQAIRSYERRDQFVRNLTFSCLSLAVMSLSAFSRGETTLASIGAGSIVGVLLTAIQHHGYNQLLERLDSERAK
jgi:hypothetical protein